MLARRVSPTLLRDILREPGPIWTQVGGVRGRCVVLFTDLMAFTPFSAALPPAELFSLLNRYFEAIAAAVIAEEGLLDKFIGDSLMAEFGVPRSRGMGWRPWRPCGRPWRCRRAWRTSMPNWPRRAAPAAPGHRPAFR